MEEYRKNFICPKDKGEVMIYSNVLQDRARSMVYLVTACDKAKRPTCKSRKEIGDFMQRTLFNVFSLQSTVVEDQFSNELGSNPRFKGQQNNYYNQFQGDSNHYYPIQHGSKQMYLDPIRTTDKRSNTFDYTFYKYGINDLKIDDSMWTYRSRSTKFINLESDDSG